MQPLTIFIPNSGTLLQVVNIYILCVKLKNWYTATIYSVVNYYQSQSYKYENILTWHIANLDNNYTCHCLNL